METIKSKIVAPKSKYSKYLWSEQQRHKDLRGWRATKEKK